MRTPDLHPASDERGFILVGVVTFMLALTILGLSLFALSSYEAQFFSASSTREQALQNCESGMGLVQTLLADRYPRNLENAQLAVGQFGVTSAIAYQQRSALESDTVSSGPVDWNSPVTIVVTAQSGSAERIVQAKYNPVPKANPYQRLMTANGISYTSNNTRDTDTFLMNGRVWQYVRSRRDTAWTDDVTWTSGRPVDPSPTPVPLADAFVDAALAGETRLPTDWSYPKTEDVEDGGDISFLNSVYTPRYYRSPPSPTDVDTQNQPEYSAYTFYSYPTMRIRIRGKVVWVVPEGICFRRTVTVKCDDDVESGSDNALIIVAKANGRHRGHEGRAIWFEGSLDIRPNAHGIYPRVFLVSQSDIGVTHHHSISTSKEARWMSIVAGGNVEIGGPDSGVRFRFGYNTAMDALADQLLAERALPPVVGGGATAFSAIRGQWAEMTPR